MEVSTTKAYLTGGEGDDDWVSRAEIVAGNGVSSQNGAVLSRLCFSRGNDSLRNTNHVYQYSVSGRLLDSRSENGYKNHHQSHYLDSCSMCNKSLKQRDIFMYRGDIPFCSEECREEEIEREEAKEKKQSLSSSIKAMRSKQQSSSSATPVFAFNSETLAAA